MSNQSPEPFAPSAPAGIPAGPAPVRAVELSRAKMVIAMAAYALYALVCVIALFVLNHRVSVANQVIHGGSVSVDQASAADDNVGTMNIVLIAALVFLLIALALSERNFYKVLGKETARRIQRQVGIRVASIVWIVVWVAGTVTQSGTPDDPQSLVAADHRSMFLLGARALLMIAIVVLTLLAYRKAREELAVRPVPQMDALAPLGY